MKKTSIYIQIKKHKKTSIYIQIKKLEKNIYLYISIKIKNKRLGKKKILKSEKKTQM